MALSWDERQGLFVGTPDRLRLRKGYIAITVVVVLFWLLLVSTFRTLAAQEPMSRDTSRAWHIAVDTLGIEAVPGTEGRGIYFTWVFAQATPTSYPSSGILVAWNCPARTVRRFAQIKFELQADSTSIGGTIQEVNLPWVPVVDERMYNLVCTIGPQHEAARGTAPLPAPAPAPKAWDGKTFDA